MELTEHLFRHEWGRMVGAVTRIFDPLASVNGSAITSFTPVSFMRAVSSASDAADGGTPGAGSIVATTTRPKRRAK